MSSSSRPFTIAIGSGVTGQRGNYVETVTQTLTELAGSVFASVQSKNYTRQQFHALPDQQFAKLKTGQRYFIGGHIREGYPRLAANLLSRSFLVFDYDDVTQLDARAAFEDAMEALGVWCATWQTISATESAPKFRAVVALADDISPTDYAQAARVFLHVASMSSWNVDPKSFVKAQPMFLPVHFIGEESDVNIIEGNPWDGATALADWTGYDLPRIGNEPPLPTKPAAEEGHAAGPSRAKEGSIIWAFNSAVPIRRAAMEMAGGAYSITQTGRITLTGSKSGPGVYIIEGGRLVSHHTTDPINTESMPDGSPYSHDAWDVVRVHRGFTQSQMFDFAESMPEVRALMPTVFADDMGEEGEDDEEGEATDAQAATPKATAGLADFTVKNGWLWWSRSEKGKTITTKIAAAITLVQIATNEEGGGAAIVIDALTHLGSVRRISLLRASLASDPRTTWALLAGLGVWFATEPGLRAQLARFLSQPADHLPRALAVTRIGWHKVEAGWAFVMPDCAFLKGKADPDIVCTSASGGGSFNTAGDLTDWAATVASPAWGNHRLMFAICFGLSGPLLAPTNTQGRGVHVLGASSSGKSTMLEVAGSVWGGGGVEGRFIRSWRTTANALEGVAQGHNDTLVALDEVGEVDPRVMGAAVYMLANGFGKSRMASDTGMRETKTWRVPFLSSGEVAPADIVRDATGREQRGGQSVRLVVLPSDAGRGLGAFNSCPGVQAGTKTAAGAAFADRLKSASAASYGVAGRAMAAKLTEYPDRGAGLAQAEMARFMAQRRDLESAELGRTASIFALAFAAGVLASQWGILPWSQESIMDCCNVCLDAVIEARTGGGGSGGYDSEAGADRLRDWIGAKGHLHLRTVGEGPANDATNHNEIFGYRKGNGEVWFTTDGVRKIVGPQYLDVLRAMVERGQARSGEGKHLQIKTRGFGGMPAGRFYVVTSLLMDDGEDE